MKPKIFASLQEFCSYPMKFVEPTSLSSFAYLISPVTEIFAVAAFALSFCSCIATLYPASSTFKLFSCAISFVNSKGKPKVSYSLNALSPSISFFCSINSSKSL